MPRVKAVRVVRHKGKVHDLCVEGRHTYNAEGLAVHNSAAGSLVSYCLGLTDIDPIEYGLLFERFLDEGRPDPPDIDTDFDPRIRDEVKKDIVRVFGETKVCSIGTYQTYKTKAVIIDVARALGEDTKLAMAVTKKIDSLSQFEDEEGESHKVDDMPFDELCEHYSDLAKYFEDNPKVRHHAEILRNQVKNMGKHAGGVIISDRSLRGRIPVLWDKPGNKVDRQVISAWAEGQEKSELSSVGLVKFDILGLNNIPVIADCVNLVEQNRRDKSGKSVVLRRASIPIDDHTAIKMGSKRDLVGIFQLENPATMPVVEAVGMESLADVSAITSLIRPGPRDMGMDMTYARRKHGEPYESIPCIEHIMTETYGVMTYQEQVMNISKALCGFDGPMANRLRKGMGKKIKSVMDEMRQKFFDGARVKIEAGEVSLKQVEQIFSLIEAFARYGFNKCVDVDTLLDSPSGTISVSDVKNRLDSNREGVVLYAFDDERIEDKCVEVIDAGEMDAYEFCFDDGSKVVCSRDHQFLCADGKMHTMEEIMEKGLDVVSVKRDSIQ